ncbi:L-type lectin-domain containing receptor kinase VII.1 [Vitis vinifera]|uniref:L-type lectin-domain containing receptor kinase VII.1 n=1 Tax=Vitis vinifera TaxID=29760 RepID=A0A438DR21_VITVI|nr:L-type lectin-domain containing receptor kinase VII.1 [Vitis vinifera]
MSSSEEDETSFKRLKLNDGKNYQVWIDYLDLHINVTMAVAGKKRPQRPLLSVALISLMFFWMTCMLASLLQPAD